MKKTCKILVLTMIIIAVVVVSLLPSGVAFADQTFHTLKVSLSSVDEDPYPLKDGFVISIHMNGPNYFEKKEFQLHGAKPDTQFFIYREIIEDVCIPDTTIVVIPAGALLYSGDSFQTDKHGNGHIITNMPPSASMLQLAKSLGIDHITMQNVICDGLGGTRAYESEAFVTCVDFKWIP